MNDIMKQLVEEANKVKALHIEVERQCKLQQEEANVLRCEKAKYIYDFLLEYWNYLKQFQMIARDFQISLTSRKEPDGYMRGCGIVFADDGIYAGSEWYQGINRGQKIKDVVCGANPAFATEAIIDGWNKGYEEKIDSRFVKYVEAVLDERLKEDTKRLKESNDILEKLKGE